MNTEQPITKLATWIPVTDDVLADVLPVEAFIEYQLGPMIGRPHPPLSVRERLTGWRSYTASNGYRLTLRVGWRSRLYRVLHPEWLRRLRYPDIYAPDDDD